MDKQLELWNQAPSESSEKQTTAIDPLVETEQALTTQAITSLFTNPERQSDFGGTSHEKWPAPEVNRDSISVDRIRNDIDGPAHRFEIRRHDFVEVFVDKDNLRYGQVVGISHKRQQVRIAFDSEQVEVWFDTACIFPAVEQSTTRMDAGLHIHQVAEAIEQRVSVQEKVALTIHKQTEYTSLKVVSLVRVGSMKGRPRITSTADACRFFAQYWAENPGCDQERFVIACLDTKNAVQSVVPITTGTLDASLVHPREVFKPAILEGSSSIILSHNHPSGDPSPSSEDRQVTERLTDVGKIIGITVLDHVIHGDGSGKAISIREA